MHYENLGILLTNQCTAECDICCFSCSTKKNNWLSFEKVIECIRMSKEVPEIKQIGFSGGEPFLDYSNLQKYIQEVDKLGIASSVTSNAFWADTYQSACEKLEILKQSGLKGVGFSYDEYHNKFVDINRIVNAILAAKTLDLEIVLQCVVDNQSHLGKIFDILGPHLVDVSVGIIPCYRVGNAEHTIEESNLIREYSCRGKYCRKSGTFSIDCYGNVWPCCSPCVIQTALSVGNIYESSISEAYERLQTNLFLRTLRNHGFDYFLNIADKVGIEYPRKIISSCELCAILFSYQNYYKFLPFILPNINN